MCIINQTGTIWLGAIGSILHSILRRTQSYRLRVCNWVQSTVNLSVYIQAGW